MEALSFKSFKISGRCERSTVFEVRAKYLAVWRTSSLSESVSLFWLIELRVAELCWLRRRNEIDIRL